VEEVLLVAIGQAGGDDVRAQPLARALRDHLLEVDELLVAAVRAAPLVL
jgi:hypothetical protein